jgi:lysophospholipase L1-like esterase
MDMNTAIIPVSKLEDDCYDWWARHSQVLAEQGAIDPEIVLIGDSITHFWGGQPESETVHGEQKAWQSVFAGKRVLNLGFGWDRTQNVLWRLEHGQLVGLSPSWIVINIGTNNTSETANARANTAEEIRDAVRAICDRVQAEAPAARIVLMGVFPREEHPEHPTRKLISDINVLYKQFAEERNYVFLDIGSLMLDKDGILSREIAFDTCHLTEKGYHIWADALRRVLS